jgi:ADP-ribosylglycohydrolase
VLFRSEKNTGSEEQFDKVYGAWLARCAGCLLGQPVEGWKRERIRNLCKDTGNFPVSGYISSDLSKEIADRYGVADMIGNKTVNWINNVSCMPEDDDMNYTIIGLKILETYGRGFTSEDVAECWLSNLPMFHLCTAERVAYRNIAGGVFPPMSAVYRNPFREWIGAQIRADFFGYISPGEPEKAAEYAWRDARISHVKNGIYGEMMVAAMLAAAAVCDDAEIILRAGLSVIPEKCRLAEKVREIVSMWKQGRTGEQAADHIHLLYDEGREYDWCHTIPNAMIVSAALLYGELALEKSLGFTLMCGFDTDCNCATVGSVIGMVLGAQALPAKWISPLHDTVISGVDGFGKVSIYQLARRTMAFMD